ncbi:dihydrofolate reductase family protein [Acaryochloris sp. IP29b_bin.137]|uniref:dihydrofolate reductase family protein n=1 Tax=Acaryochloris sp. IP29b_bin.137 TaxID=2969217 RepID=UPI002610B04C|nr:dihydrofolate reductase family protein [Acaryochloris sp. IP29b_bin.137]
MRKLKYYIASTVDGFIAHQDGSLDGFLMTGDHVSDYLAALKQFDAVLMGRKTYEVGVKEGVTNPYPHMQQFVISRTLQTSPDESITVVSDGLETLVRDLKARTGQDIYLCGGGQLATTLLAAQLIDDIILKVNPVLFGTGIPLFAGSQLSIPTTRLQLSDHTIYSNGLVLLLYTVLYD